jgi:hypothetical protein
VLLREPLRLAPQLAGEDHALGVERLAAGA